MCTCNKGGWWHFGGRKKDCMHDHKVFASQRWMFLYGTNWKQTVWRMAREWNFVEQDSCHIITCNWFEFVMIFIPWEEAQYAEFPKALEEAIISTNCNKNNLEFHFRFVQGSFLISFCSELWIHTCCQCSCNCRIENLIQKAHCKP